MKSAVSPRFSPPGTSRVEERSRRLHNISDSLGVPPGGGHSWEFLVGVCRPVPQILTRFQTKKCRFSTVQTKNYSKFRIRIFLFLANSFGIKTINTYIHSVVPSKTIPDSRPKWAKCIPVFRPKWRKNPTR